MSTQGWGMSSSVKALFIIIFILFSKQSFQNMIDLISNMDELLIYLCVNYFHFIYSFHRISANNDRSNVSWKSKKWKVPYWCRQSWDSSEKPATIQGYFIKHWYSKWSQKIFHWGWLDSSFEHSIKVLKGKIFVYLKLSIWGLFSNSSVNLGLKHAFSKYTYVNNVVIEFLSSQFPGTFCIFL